MKNTTTIQNDGLQMVACTALFCRSVDSWPHVCGNAPERKETGKFPHWNGCKYRQFTRGSTWTHGMNGMTGGANDNIKQN